MAIKISLSTISDGVNMLINSFCLIKCSLIRKILYIVRKILSKGRLDFGQTLEKMH